MQDEYNFVLQQLQLLRDLFTTFADYPSGFFFNFQARMLGGGGAKKYNIDYFGYAVNLGFKFKLNFDVIRSNKEKSQNSKQKSSIKLL